MQEAKRKAYTRIIECSDADHCYIGSIPKLSSRKLCHGYSLVEVIESLDEIEDLLLEDMDSPPAPLGISVVVHCQKITDMPATEWLKYVKKLI